MRPWLKAAAVCPAAGIGPLPYWLVVSTTIRPPRSPACESASSITDQGTEKTTTSAPDTASAGVATAAPSSSASALSAAWSRANERATEWPARAAWRATFPPIRPGPTMAMFMPAPFRGSDSRA